MNGSVHHNNTNNFWVLGLTDEDTGSFINDATVTWEIRTEPWDKDGVEAGTQVATGSGTYKTASDGDYRCDVLASVALAKGTRYYRKATAVKAGVGTWECEDSFVAGRRTGQTPTT